MDIRNDLRNIAIVAHVNYGKTTLVGQLLRQSGIFHISEAVIERVMGSNDLERERGITIPSRNIAIMYGGTKINIVDTPGHADFDGETECILMMVGGVPPLADAFEGCMPQTRSVLKKALGPGERPVVVVSKIDRPGARPLEVVDRVLDLFIELGTDESQLEFPVVYASSRDGHATLNPDRSGENMIPLFEPTLKFVPASWGGLEGPAQVLFSNIDYDDYLRHISIGRVERGKIRDGQSVVLCGHEDGNRSAHIVKLYQFEGLKRVEVTGAALGDIVAVSDITGLSIGETAYVPDYVESLPFVRIDELTVSMVFMVNNSPFVGKEGKFVTSCNLRDRLFKEVETNVALRVEETGSADMLKISGHGELYLSILIETMRRQNYEFQVSHPSVIHKTIGDKRCKPIELLAIEVPDQYVGTVMEKFGSHKTEIVNIGTRESGVTHMEFKIPARGLTGYRSEFLTDTNGDGIVNHVFDSYEPYRDDIAQHTQGLLVVYGTSPSTAYGLSYAQGRGKLFIDVSVEAYEGMIVGVSPKQEDITVNICKEKHVTNTRASNSGDVLRLMSHTVLSLEQSLEFITEGKLMEVTPKSTHMRKMIPSKERRTKQSNRKE